MKIKSRQTQKSHLEQNQKIRPEVAKLIKQLSKKYAGVWKDLAKI